MAEPTTDSSTQVVEKDNGKEEWDSFFCVPTDDVHLLSDDGIHFRASSHRLSQASGLFAVMFQAAGKGSGQLGEAIKLQFDRDTVRAFLDLISTSKPCLALLDDLNTPTAFNLHRLVVQYDCTGYETTSQARWDSAIRRDPIEAFVIASKTNDVALGRKALENALYGQINKAGLASTVSQLRNFLDRLNARWRPHLVELLLTDDPHRDNIRIAMDRTFLGKSFDPDGTYSTKPVESR